MWHLFWNSSKMSATPFWLKVVILNSADSTFFGLVSGSMKFNVIDWAMNMYLKNSMYPHATKSTNPMPKVEMWINNHFKLRSDRLSETSFFMHHRSNFKENVSVGSSSPHENLSIQRNIFGLFNAITYCSNNYLFK